MSQIYEGMFLLDNQVVREGWKAAKAIVDGILEKHGGAVLTSRRWDERRLTYPIQGCRRATYLLTYYQLPSVAFAAARRDLDLNEKVLRYLMLAVDAVAEGEAELAEAENAADFTVPPPPPDDAPEREPEPEVGAQHEKPRPPAEEPAEGPAEGPEEGPEEGSEERSGGAAPEAAADPAPAAEPSPETPIAPATPAPEEA